MIQACRPTNLTMSSFHLDKAVERRRCWAGKSITLKRAPASATRLEFGLQQAWVFSPLEKRGVEAIEFPRVLEGPHFQIYSAPFPALSASTGPQPTAPPFRSFPLEASDVPTQAPSGLGS